MTACQQVVAAWNAQADELNQWADLGEDEKIEWALKCADQFRDATKLMQAARQAHNIDTAILDPVHYGSLREALIAALGIESNA